MVRFSDGPSLSYPSIAPSPPLPSSRRPFVSSLSPLHHPHAHSQDPSYSPSNLDSDGQRASPCPVLLLVPSVPRVLISSQTRRKKQEKKQQQQQQQHNNRRSSDLFTAERRAHFRLTYVCNTLRLGPLNDPVKTLKLETRQWRLAHRAVLFTVQLLYLLLLFPSDNRELSTPIPSLQAYFGDDNKQSKGGEHQSKSHRGGPRHSNTSDFSTLGFTPLLLVVLTYRYCTSLTRHDHDIPSLTRYQSVGRFLLLVLFCFFCFFCLTHLGYTSQVRSLYVNPP